MIRVDPWAYVVGALLLLTVPLNWLIAAVCAAVLHELCHIFAIYLADGKIREIRIGISGTVMDTGILDDRQELFCALAGPVSSFSLVLLCRHFPRLAICGGIQGLFNLLPIWPLDGGRALRCCLQICFPKQAEKLGRFLESAAVFCLMGLAVLASGALSLGILPFCVAALLCIKAILRKKPCKRNRIRVQ